MVLLPPVLEIAGYGTDEAEYTAISDVFRPPDRPPDIIPVIADNHPKETEEPVLLSVPKKATESPTQEEPQSEEAVEAFADGAEYTAPEPLPALADEIADPTVTKLPPEPVPKAETVQPISKEKPASKSQASFDQLLAQNPDFIAWLSIPGTVIDYPVVQSNNTEYYLSHLFTGNKSKLGCLFSLKNADFRNPGRNIAIYGHHLSASNAMFSTLLNYKKESYFETHPLIRLNSLYHSSTYRIFAVFNMKISDWDIAAAGFSGNDEFLRFVNRAKKKAMYDTGIEVSADARLLTLITCDRSYGGVTGRFIVMAVLQE